MSTGPETTLTVAVVGAGALGRVVVEILREEAGIAVAGLFDDSAALQRRSIADLPVEATGHLARVAPRPHIVIAIAHVATRKRLWDSLSAEGYAFATVIHRTAHVSVSASVGPGVIVKAGAVIETAARVAENAVIGTGTLICHDSIIGPHCYVHAAVTLAGACRIGAGCTVGAGAIFAPRVVVAADRTIDPGAVVTTDVT